MEQKCEDFDNSLGENVWMLQQLNWSKSVEAVTSKEPNVIVLSSQIFVCNRVEWIIIYLFHLITYKHWATLKADRLSWLKTQSIIITLPPLLHITHTPPPPQPVWRPWWSVPHQLRLPAHRELHSLHQAILAQFGPRGKSFRSIKIEYYNEFFQFMPSKSGKSCALVQNIG